MTSSSESSPTGAKALLIDFGGVLTVSVLEAFSSACSSMGVDADGFLRECFSSSHDEGSPFVAIELGRITTEEFGDAITPVLRRHATEPVDGRTWYAAVEAVTWNIDSEMVVALEKLVDQGVPTSLVSNSWGPTYDYPWQQLPRFTDVVVSRDVGLRKPDPRIYSLAAERLGVSTSECVFVDDLDVNLEPAQALGMTTILHTASEQTIGQLRQMFPGSQASSAATARTENGLPAS